MVPMQELLSQAFGLWWQSQQVLYKRQVSVVSQDQTATDWLRKAGGAAAHIVDGTINILDLGSATGKNSARELRAAIEAVRQAEGTGQQHDIIITHVDATGNDWNQLCQTVNSPDSYLTGHEKVYSHSQAKSFFNQCAPASSVAIAYSGIAFHWTSASKPLSDCAAQYPDTVDKETYEWNRQSAAEDWLQILRMRAVELLPGGHLIATACTLKGCESQLHFALIMNQAWRHAAEKGFITHEECRTFAARHWWRSREEWLGPLGADGEHGKAFEVLDFQENEVTDAHWTEYKNSNEPEDVRAQALATGYSKLFFGVVPGQFSAHLPEQSPQDFSNMIEFMRKDFINMASKIPIKMTLAFALIVLKRR